MESQSGKGARFFVTVPLGEPTFIALAPRALVVDIPDLAGLRVLVIDDDAAICASTQILLSQWGCECITAESEADAIHQLHMRPLTIDVMVVDIVYAKIVPAHRRLRACAANL